MHMWKCSDKHRHKYTQIRENVQQRVSDWDIIRLSKIDPMVGIRNTLPSSSLSTPHLWLKFPTRYHSAHHVCQVPYHQLWAPPRSSPGKQGQLCGAHCRDKETETYRGEGQQPCRVSAERPRSRLQLPGTNYLCTVDIWYPQKTLSSQVHKWGNRGTKRLMNLI